MNQIFVDSIFSGKMKPVKKMVRNYAFRTDGAEFSVDSA